MGKSYHLCIGLMLPAFHLVPYLLLRNSEEGTLRRFYRQGHEGSDSLRHLSKVTRLKWRRQYSETEPPDPTVTVLSVMLCDVGRAPKFCLLHSLPEVQVQFSHCCGQILKCLHFSDFHVYVNLFQFALCLTCWSMCLMCLEWKF